jgi:hypothetical protein
MHSATNVKLGKRRPGSLVRLNFDIFCSELALSAVQDWHTHSSRHLLPRLQGPNRLVLS